MLIKRQEIFNYYVDAFYVIKRNLIDGWLLRNLNRLMGFEVKPVE